MKNETKSSQQLFKNPSLEKLTHTDSKIAIGVYVVLSMGILFYGILATSISFWQAFLLFNLGRLAFTLIEYLLHRFVYHSGHYDQPTEWQYKVHGIHHKHPNVEDQLAMPIPIALALLFLFYLLFNYLLGTYSLFFFPGFTLGYGFYLTMHYLIHMRKAPKNYFRWFWRHHHVHHRFDDTAFGLSTRIWDRIFRTMPPKRLDN